MASHLRPVVKTRRGGTGTMLGDPVSENAGKRSFGTNLSNARMALRAARVGEAPSATRAGQLDRNRDSAQAFDLAEDLDQALLPLGARLGHRDPYLPAAHVEDRAELGLETSPVSFHP